ncbi:MAG TPA: hypothetical protein VFJ62_02605 [Usitatibacter sp.]|nr:hypothetical protein [Usitatibacter sp.]
MANKDVLLLQQPLKDGGIRSVNFFNGRLLSGKDFSREQAARREADARLGLATGDGVAFGLEVARDTDLDQAAAPVLRIRAGLAVNRLGQTLRLMGDVSVALTRGFDAQSADCVFASCTPLKGGTYVAGAGVYLLTIAPAGTSEGRAASNGLDPANVACNSDAMVEALQFRLIGVSALRFAGLDPSSPQFRNRLAYRCFGIEAREASAIDPWRVDAPSYGLIDELRDVGLDDRDVPLALLFWTAAGLQFVDTWAARRALLAPDALSGFSFQRDPLKGDDLSSFAFIARRRALVEAQAMCAQFQEHLADVLAEAANPMGVAATDRFRYLPPFGIVPLRSGPLRGFDEAGFFTGVVRPPRPGSTAGTPFIDARLLGTLQALALSAAPTDLGLPQGQKEFIRVYRPWQNAKAIADSRPVQPMLAFASGLVPDLGTARFDMARFDYANYAGCC